MKLVDSPITNAELNSLAKSGFGNFIKAVVDVEKKIMVVGASLHADEEAHLLTLGSKQQDLWGINIYPELDGDDAIEFDSMINVRPSQHNLTRGVESGELQSQIRAIVNSLII